MSISLFTVMLLFLTLLFLYLFVANFKQILHHDLPFLLLALGMY